MSHVHKDALMVSTGITYPSRNCGTATSSSPANFPATNLPHAAAAIIAALSVERAIAGKATGSPRRSASAVNRRRSSELAATSHDTFNRVFQALDPDELEQGFVGWVSSIARLTAGEVIAIDGKALCGTRETGKKALVHMVSAWAEQNGLVLGQRKVDDKSNEITAIPKLLDALELAGTVVTIDAMGCQRESAARIVARKADYVLAVKDNQGLLAEQVRDSFLLLNSDAVAEEIDCGHGRVERRRCFVEEDWQRMCTATGLNLNTVEDCVAAACTSLRWTHWVAGG